MYTDSLKQNTEIKIKQLQTTNKSRYFFNYKTLTVKIKHECIADNKIFLYYNAGAG